MSQILGKTVYVLGAGASVHAGTPLLADFLARARELQYRTRDISCRESFDRVFAWIEELKRASYYIDINLDNLEHVFSMADLGRQIGVEDCDQHFSDLRKMIAEVLDHCELPQLEPLDKGYRLFLQRLKQCNDGRKQKTALGEAFSADSVITFNYDILLDDAWEHPELAFRLTYSLDQASFDESGPYLLLKLHGSTNWAYCSECGAVEPLKVSSLRPHCVFKEEAVSGRPGVPDTKIVKLKASRWTTGDHNCTTCGKITQREPLIIPPTWSKQVANSPIVPVWKRAVREVTEANQLVIIGYSLPATDTFLQYLMALGASHNVALQRVVVVNNDGSDAFRSRYRQLFSRSLSERRGLMFIAAPFTSFCSKIMQHINADSQELARTAQAHDFQVE